MHKPMLAAAFAVVAAGAAQAHVTLETAEAPIGTLQGGAPRAARLRRRGHPQAPGADPRGDDRGQADAEARLGARDRHRQLREALRLLRRAADRGRHRDRLDRRPPRRLLRRVRLPRHADRQPGAGDGRLLPGRAGVRDARPSAGSRSRPPARTPRASRPRRPASSCCRRPAATDRTRPDARSSRSLCLWRRSSPRAVPRRMRSSWPTDPPRGAVVASAPAAVDAHLQRAGQPARRPLVPGGRRRPDRGRARGRGRERLVVPAAAALGDRHAGPELARRLRRRPPGRRELQRLDRRPDPRRLGPGRPARRWPPPSAATS